MTTFPEKIQPGSLVQFVHQNSKLIEVEKVISSEFLNFLIKNQNIKQHVLVEHYSADFLKK